MVAEHCAYVIFWVFSSALSGSHVNHALYLEGPSLFLNWAICFPSCEVYMPLSLMSAYFPFYTARDLISRMHIWLTVAVVGLIAMTKTVSDCSSMFAQVLTCLMFKVGK